MLVPYYEQCLRLRLAARLLHLSSDCTCAALTLYHRYQRDSQLGDPPMLAACLFCATKLEEAECRTADLLNVVEAVTHPSAEMQTVCAALQRFPSAGVAQMMTGERYYAAKERLIAAEHLLLRTLHFDVVVPHPQRELLSLCRDLELTTAVTTVATRLMNDALAYTDFILIYEPGAIAASVLYTALILADIQITTVSRKPWYEALGLDVTVVETLGHQLIDTLTAVTFK